MKLLRIPVDHYNDVIKLLKITEYIPVISALGYRGRTQIAAYIIQNMLDNDTQITEDDQIEKVWGVSKGKSFVQVFNLIESLLVDQSDQPQELESSEDFQEEQNFVARLVNLVYNENPDLHFRVR